MGRIHRYLFAEIARPLAAALLFLLQLLFAIQLLRGTDVILGSAVRARDVLHIVGFMLPHFLAMALPVAFLVAVLLGLGRLSEDRELLALSAAGVRPHVLLPVPLAIAGALALVGLGLGQGPEPHGLSGLRDYAETIIRKNLQGDVRAGVFFTKLPDLTLYAEEVDPRTHAWRNVLVHDDRDRTAPLLVLARAGHLEADPRRAEISLLLGDGEVHRSVATGDEYARMHFERGDLRVALGGGLAGQSGLRLAKDELTAEELRARAQQAEARGQPAHELWVDAARRSALPLAPLAFALVAVPLGARLRRGARAGGVALAALFYALYYVVGRLGEQWGDTGVLGPAWAAQLPNLAFAALGLLLWSLLRRRA